MEPFHVLWTSLQIMFPHIWPLQHHWSQNLHWKFWHSGERGPEPDENYQRSPIYQGQWSIPKQKHWQVSSATHLGWGSDEHLRIQIKIIDQGNTICLLVITSTSHHPCSGNSICHLAITSANFNCCKRKLGKQSGLTSSTNFFLKKKEAITAAFWYNRGDNIYLSGFILNIYHKILAITSAKTQTVGNNICQGNNICHKIIGINICQGNKICLHVW